MLKPFSLYVHIPFCLHKCPYCDFNTYAVHSIPEEEYVSALLSELDFRATLPEWRLRPIQSVYFGGGTPSLLKPKSIGRIVSLASALFPMLDDVEITLEANPGTVDAENLQGFRDSGINRLSLGAQSFDREILKTLGRQHSPELIEAAVAAAQAAGFRNISLDIIYGSPGQNLQKLKHDLDCLLELAPQHISAYGLTIEKGTPFYLSYKSGELTLPTEEEVLSMMEQIATLLPQHGYERYEISNFSAAAFQAHHNLAYWNGDDYLGLGAGAHSFYAVFAEKRKKWAKRWANFALPDKYMLEAVSQGVAEAWHEDLDQEALIGEFFFLGLRKIKGVSLKEFQECFDCTVHELFPVALEVLTQEALICIQDDQLKLSGKGLLLADSVTEHFLKVERKKMPGLPFRSTSYLQPPQPPKMAAQG